jgi:hypothetical protein
MCIIDLSTIMTVGNSQSQEVSMNAPSACTHRPTRIIRWTARLWSLLGIGFLLLMFLGEGGPGIGILFSTDGVLFLCFPLGVVAGMTLGWWREGLGGAITLAGLVGFYAAHWFLSGRFPGGPWFLLTAAPGFFFLLARGISVGSKRTVA